MSPQPALAHWLGLQDYQTVWQAMRDYTASRGSESPDQLWALEHPAVFTQGQAGRAEHLLMPGDIPVVQTDRGGQVTYHGPGQLVVYPLLDIRRLGFGPKRLVMALEQSMIDCLAEYDITATARRDAPGVYVNEKKIGSIGMRIRRGCCYHGLSLNVAMDLSPYERINPCGYSGLDMTQVSALTDTLDENADNVRSLADKLLPYLAQHLGIAVDAWQVAHNPQQLLASPSDEDGAHSQLGPPP